MSESTAKHDWADVKAVEIFEMSGSDMGYRAKEGFLIWLAQELRDLVTAAMEGRGGIDV
jgi:hypothetical protein